MLLLFSCNIIFYLTYLNQVVLNYVDRDEWRRKWQPTPVFLPGEPLGQRSLAGYSP